MLAGNKETQHVSKASTQGGKPTDYQIAAGWEYVSRVGVRASQKQPRTLLQEAQDLFHYALLFFILWLKGKSRFPLSCRRDPLQIQYLHSVTTHFQPLPSAVACTSISVCSLSAWTFCSTLENCKGGRSVKTAGVWREQPSSAYVPHDSAHYRQVTIIGFSCQNLRPGCVSNGATINETHGSLLASSEQGRQTHSVGPKIMGRGC